MPKSKTLPEYDDDWTDEQWAQWEADADQRDIETSLPSLVEFSRQRQCHGVMPGGVQDRARSLAAAKTEAAVGRVVGSPL